MVRCTLRALCCNCPAETELDGKVETQWACQVLPNAVVQLALEKKHLEERNILFFS
jgi:hypothetical protein